MNKTRTTLPLSALLLNEGQLDWLPRNPRTWTKEDVERTAKSIAEDPDFLEDRPVLAIPFQDGKYIVFGGNLRREGSKAAGRKDVPAVVYVPESDDDRTTILRRAMKDNGSFGSWDYDALANEWDDLPLADFGVPVWDFPHEQGKGSGEGSVMGTEDEDETREPKEKIDAVETLLNDAMRENVRESVKQIDFTMKKGWLASFLTKGLAQAKFIRAKYYGEKYPQWVSLYFSPERFWTSTSSISCYEALSNIASGKTDAGIAGLRTLSGDHLLLLLLLKGSYPFASARMPMDFPANVACDLIKEFGGAGCSVLDPCHGWGGRLCGALMADAGRYVGVDPSPEVNAGVRKMYEAFGGYQETKAEFIQLPFEDVELQPESFDFALTSPPYFDVEQYHGEGQSYIRYPVFQKWVEGFYRPLIEKVFAALKKGGVFALQVGSQKYPLLDTAKEISSNIGFNIMEIRPLGGGTASALHGKSNDDEDNEKIIILAKS